MLLILGSALGCGSALAQINTGEIRGSVRDPLGGFIADAVITADRPATGITYTAITNSSGEFLLAQLPLGEYSLSIAADGFKKGVMPALEVHSGERLRREFTLEVGTRNEVVTVDVAFDLLDSGSGSIRDGILQNQILALPLKGRQFLDLALLGEGVVRPPGGTRGDALQQAGTLVNILGQRSGHEISIWWTA